MTLAEYLSFMTNRYFYHFTDIRNLPMIERHDGLWSVRELGKKSISVAAPGGNDWSHQADAHAGVDDYVHLCFCDQHPMEYEAKSRGHIGETRFLRIKTDVLKTPGIRLTLEVSNKSGAQMLTLESGCGQLDLEVIYERTNWRDPVVMGRLQLARKCELLVPQHVPLSLIVGI